MRITSFSITAKHCRILNPLNPSGDYMYHTLYQSVTLYFVCMGLL
jgi:hypothetical protein